MKRLCVIASGPGEALGLGAVRFARMILTLPVGAGLEAFTGREREKLAWLWSECLLKARKREGRPFTLHSRHLQSNYGRNYARLIQYLLNVQAVRLRPYANGLTYFDRHSRRFVLAACPGGVQEVEISEKTKAAQLRKRGAQAAELCAAIEGGVHLLNVWPELSIDAEAANAHLNKLERRLNESGEIDLKPSRKGAASPRERLAFRRLSVSWFGFNGLSFNERTGRVYSPLTNLPRDLRPFLQLRGGGRLCLVDIRNSQPFVLAAMYADATKDKGPLKAAAAGSFYEVVNARRPDMSRDEVKLDVLRSIYDNRLTPKCEGGRALVEAFPAFWDWVCRERSKAGPHLALRMQKVEADWVLRVACALAKGGRFIASIHDAFLIDEARRDEVESALSAAAVERWGVGPSFGFESIFFGEGVRRAAPHLPSEGQNAERCLK